MYVCQVLLRSLCRLPLKNMRYLSKTKADKTEALKAALQQLDKSFGKGSVMKLGESSTASVPVISTGSLSLDVALGIGGLPKGRVVEIYGPESCGKTTLALHVVAEAQKTGGVCTFVDAEHALDPIYAKALGVNIEELFISQPNSGEQALEITDTLVRSGAVDVIVIDSVAALVPRVELEGEMGDSHIALQARLMSQALRKITGSLSQSKCLLIFINQVRHRVGVLFGSPEVTPGGNALKFYSSIRLDVRRVTSIKEGTKVIGNRVRVKVAKNKLAPPFRQAEFDMEFGKGIARTSEIVDMGLHFGLIEKSGSWFSLAEAPESSKRIGQGKDKVKQYLLENPEITTRLEAAIKERAKNSTINITIDDIPEDTETEL